MYHFGEMYPIRLNEYYKRYSEINSKPKFWHILITLPSIIFQGPQSLKNFIRFVLANQISNKNALLDSKNPPKIIVAIVVASKDFHLIKSCIEFAIKNSLNPVSKVSIVTPHKDRENCLEIVKVLEISTPIEVISEEVLISEEDRSKIRTFFGNKYGWIIQQLLKISFVKEQNSSGVLIVDADTLVLEPTLWLDRHFKQLLLVSNEFHKPYYQFLIKIGLIPKNPQYTFVTHHMVLQPMYLESILNKICGGSISKLIDLIISLADRKNSSPVCVEYELYGQGMFEFFSESIVLSRFCNLPLKYEGNAFVSENFVEVYAGKYKSISLHSYLN